VPFEEHRAQLFTQHAHWDAFFVCSHCGESVRQVLAKCPLCHARMDEQF
jgi:rubrerythrin